MLMASRFDSYCRLCGFPILEGDLFDYQLNERGGGGTAACLLCHSGIPRIEPCPHLAVWTTDYQFSPYNKYRYSNGPELESLIECKGCGMRLRGFPESLLVMETTVTRQHGAGHSSKRNQFDVFEHHFPRYFHRFHMFGAALWNLMQSGELDEKLRPAAQAHFGRLLRLLP